MFCLICNNLIDLSKAVCTTCNQQIEKLAITRQPTANQILLYRYEEPLRQLVLDAKIIGNLSILFFLIDLVMKHPLVRRSLHWAEAIMPAPSSLWGRLHGKTDLAYLIAATLARSAKIKLVKPPRQLGWHYKKQSMRQQRTIAAPGISRPKSKMPTSKKPKIILLDDISTSGETLRSLHQTIGTPNCIKICLAKAPSAL